MLSILRRRLLLLLAASVLVWWIILIISHARAFINGDKQSGVVALVMFGLLIGALGAGIAGYRRFQVEWKKRIDEQV